jgi:hypothetical protein
MSGCGCAGTVMTGGKKPVKKTTKPKTSGKGKPKATKKGKGKK